jgi:tRNA dimethylallyltransferase
MKFDAVLIAGPTASGKSRAAMELAKEIGGVVVNADSMQVYREVRILSARPSDADMAAVPHALYGHVSVTETYSVGRYQADAIGALAAARQKGQVPIFTGGTGLYFAALTEGLSNIPPTPAPVREAARARLNEIGVAALHVELAARDPETAAGLRSSDPQRVLRAYEVWEATHRPLLHWQRESGKPVLGGLRVQKFVLDVPRPELRVRIETRFRQMLAEGAREEAKLLAELDPALPAAKILGAAELASGLPDEEAIALAAIATRQFAKRQSTWFRNRMADWDWVDASDMRNNIAHMAEIIS